MNTTSLEQELLGTFKQQHKNEAFIAKTMQAVRRVQAQGAFQTALDSTAAPKRKWWQSVGLRRVTTTLAVLFAVSALSISGYAYASGTNPISLIRRWIVGDEVKVQYNGHTYEYGSSNNYSDAAITAYQELQQVGLLNFHAGNEFLAPHDGAEYLSPLKSTYTYPWLGTLERIDDTNVYIRQQHLMQDKMLRTSPSNELVAIPKANLWFYMGTKRVNATTIGVHDVDKVIYVTESSYLRHEPGSHAVPTQFNEYFGYELTHSLAELEEAGQKGGQTGKTQPISEPGMGGYSTICNNNGADKCDGGKIGSSNGEGLYAIASGANTMSNAYNPNSIPYGEGAPDDSRAADGYVSRDLQGHISAITDTDITIQTSSGAHWTLAYGKDQRQQFAKLHRPLRVGDEIIGSVLSSLTDLDNRSIPGNCVSYLKRL